MYQSGYRIFLTFLFVAGAAAGTPEIDVKSIVQQEIDGYSMAFPKKITSDGVSLCWKGGGLRKKKVLIASVKVYELQSYGPCGTKQFPQVLSLKFLRDIDREKIRSSFKEALDKNGVATTKASPLGDLLAQWNTDMKEHETLWLVAYETKAGQWVELDAGKGGIRAEGPTVANDLWKIWYGKPADSGLEELRSHLLSETGK